MAPHVVVMTVSRARASVLPWLVTLHVLASTACRDSPAGVGKASLGTVQKEPALPSAESDGIDAVKRWARDRIRRAEHDFKRSGAGRYPSPAFWGGEIVYEIQVDRFNNGDPSNDRANLEPFQIDHQDTGDLYRLQDYRHGGDLRGIVSRLDYLRDLGITSLWITPVLKGDGSYHGYCTVDFSQVDPSFGSNEDLRRLVVEAHRRNIKVVLDVVVNHVCDSGTHYRTQADHDNCPRRMNDKYWSGQSGGVEGQGELAFSDRFFRPLRSQWFYNRCGANTYDETSSEDPPSVFGDFTSVMFDFDTRNYDFQEVLTDLYKYWIAYADVDGFRIDAAKHVTADFAAYFSTEIRDYAKQIGKNNFYLIGEVAGPADWQGRMVGEMSSNPHDPDEHGVVPAALTSRMWKLKDTYLAHGISNYPGFNAIFDFSHGGMARAMLLNHRNTRDVEDYFDSDEFRTIAGQNDARLDWNVLEIHDWPRFLKRFKDEPWKAQLGLAYLATAQGTPVIYYGQEQGFNQDCHLDKISAGAATDELGKMCKEGSNFALYRQDMFLSGPFRLGSAVASIDELAYIGKTQPGTWDDWKTDPFLRRDHAIYQTARKMNYIRQSCNALRSGRVVFRLGESKTEGLLAFSRIDNGQEVVVILNNASYSIPIPHLPIDGGINHVPGQRYENLLNGSQVAWTGVDRGSSYLYFNGMQIDGNSVMVFVHEDAVAPYSSYLGAYQCTDHPQWPPFD